MIKLLIYFYVRTQKTKNYNSQRVERELNNIVPFILKKAKSAPIVETPDGAVCSGHATMQYRKTEGDDYEERADPEND